MNNIEYEHSFKVQTIEPYTDFCKNNGFKLVSKEEQNRVVYENAFNDKVIARLTTKVFNGQSKTFLDFKNVQEKTNDLNISKESIPLEVTTNNREQIMSILATLSFKEVANNLRIRYVYQKSNVKFEIDNYIRPEMNVVAIEGENEEVENIYSQIKDLNYEIQ